MYTIDSILKILETHTWTSLQLSANYKHLFISEAEQSGLEKSIIDKLIKLDPNMSMGQLWAYSYNTLWDSLREKMPQVNYMELEVNEMLIKLLPPNQKSLELIKNNVTFLLTQYTEKEILYTLKQLLSATNQKIETLNALNEKLEHARNFDPNSKETMSSELRRLEELLCKFDRKEYPASYEKDDARRYNKQFAKLGSLQKAYKIYNEYRLKQPLLETNPAPEIQDDDLSTESLIRKQQRLLQKTEDAYVKPGALREQLFTCIIDLNVIKTETGELQLSPEEEPYKELPLHHADDDDNIINYSSLFKKIKRKNNLYFNLLDCLNQWTESVKQELLNLYVEKNSWIQPSDYKKNGIITFPDGYLTRFFPYLAERDPKFTNAWETFLFLQKLLADVTNEFKTINKKTSSLDSVQIKKYISIDERASDCFQQLKLLPQNACHTEKFYKEAFDLCVQIICGISSNKLGFFKPLSSMKPENPDFHFYRDKPYAPVLTG